MVRSSIRAVPDHPRRVRGIVRVSKEREGMIAPELQEHAIREHCQARGHILLEPFIYGIDDSGSSTRSAWWRKLDQAIAEVESGEVEGIIVWKFSRVARHRLKWAVAVDRVETAGGIIESATEQFDTTTSAGRFARGMTAEMNAFTAEMISESWREVHERRVRSGRPHGGRGRWGYRYDREQGLYVPDPETGPVLADLYRRYVAGESCYVLARWLNARGFKTLADGSWSDRTLRRVFNSGFASGQFLFRGEMHEGQHEPLIDRELWQAYLDARELRRVLPARVVNSTYPLSGLVRCARCGGAMVANVSDPGTKLHTNGKRYSAGRPRSTFRCVKGREQGKTGCQGGYIVMRIVEEHVREHLAEVASRIEESAADQAVVGARRAVAASESVRLAREAAKVREALVRLATDHALNPMPPAIYAEAKTRLEQRAAELEDAAEDAGRTARRGSPDPAAAAAGLLEQWDEIPTAALREVLRGLIDCVLVRTGVERALRVVEWEEVRAYAPPR